MTVIAIQAPRLGDFIEGTTIHKKSSAGRIIGGNRKNGWVLENGKRIIKIITKIRQDIQRVERDRVLYDDGTFISRRAFIAAKGRYKKRIEK